MEEMERELIRKALARNNGNRKETARKLGIGERTLYRKLKKYQLS
jgi:DNA-binding NtrC family response regulator